MSLSKQQRCWHSLSSSLASRSVTKCEESNTIAFTNEKFPLHVVIVKTIISLCEKNSPTNQNSYSL